MIPLVAAILAGAVLPCAAVDLATVGGVVDQVRAASFPDLAGKRIAVRAFTSDSDYFRSQFRLFPMRYAVLANRKGDPPTEGVRAIVAHELSHVAYYSHGRALRLLGLARLVIPRYRSRFERAADLDAIRRGYGPGLKAYREWLYKNIPARSLPEKMRDYLSPHEIDEALRNKDPHGTDDSHE
jgi:hypothetical protein